MKATVLVCSPYPIDHVGMGGMLEATEDLQLVATASTEKLALKLMEKHKPSVCLVDKVFGVETLLQFTEAAKARSPETKLILWTREIREAWSFQALQVGMRGILKKTASVETILECLRMVAQGNIWIEKSISDQFVGFINRRNTPYLTSREEEIMGLVARGMKNKQIADALCIATGTVKIHIMHVMEKIGIHNRVELAMWTLGRQPKPQPPIEGFGGADLSVVKQ